MYNFQFKNLCGSVYVKGNILFTPDGNSLLSPVGNRVTHYDLVNHSSTTLPFGNQRNISRMAISPNGSSLITVDEKAYALFINFPKRIVLGSMLLNGKASVVQFSPDSKYIAFAFDPVGSGSAIIQVWKTPGRIREHKPFVLKKSFNNAFPDKCNCLDWSSNSAFLICGGDNMLVKVYSMNSNSVILLGAQKSAIVGCYFTQKDDMIITVAQNGGICFFKYAPTKEFPYQDTTKFESITPENSKNGRFKFITRHNQPFDKATGQVISAQYHKSTGLLVLGYATGVFSIYEILITDGCSVNHLQSLSISKHKISSMAINSTGDWISFGISRSGQLLVWEWKSESYVLKQSGHFDELTTMGFTPDSQSIVTGDYNGKLKLWNLSTGFCFVTFDTQHAGSITSIAFAKSPIRSQHSFFSASLDGTVRAWDLTRYRNFRIFKTAKENPVQFISLAVDPAGEIIAAGTMEPFEIYLWSVQTAKLLDILGGHEGPVCSLQFGSKYLLSGSWDKSVRVWDVFNKNSTFDIIKHSSDVLDLKLNEINNLLATVTLDGNICVWDLNEIESSPGNNLIANIDCKLDLYGSSYSNVTLNSNSNSKWFTSIDWSVDGESVIVAGHNSVVLIYHVAQRLLIRKFSTSFNLSFDGVAESINWRAMNEIGSMDMVDDEGDFDEDERMRRSLPGVLTGQLTSKRMKSRLMVTKKVEFGPTGNHWAAVTTEGLLVYSLERGVAFDPFDLDVDITPESTLATLELKNYLKALIMSFKLNEKDVIDQVFYKIPSGSIVSVVKDVPAIFLSRLLEYVAKEIAGSPHIEFNLLWASHILNYHGNYLKDNSNSLIGQFRDLQKSINEHFLAVSRMADSNNYMLEYITTAPAPRQIEEITEEPVREESLFKRKRN